MFLRPNYRSKDGKNHTLRNATHKVCDAGCIVTQSCGGSTTAPHSQLKDLVILADAITPHNHDTVPHPNTPVERNVMPSGDGSGKQQQPHRPGMWRRTR
jgi:hypothetical protein